MKDNESPQIEEEDEQKKTLFQRFKYYISSMISKAKGNAVIKAASNTYEKLSQTKVYKILTSKAVSRTIGLVSIIAGAAGLFAVAPISLPIMAAGLIAAVGVDTYMVYRTKKLYKEAKMLRDNKLALDKQRNILDKHPSLKKALEDRLFTPNKTGHSKFEKPQSKTNPIMSLLGGAGLAIASSIGGVVNSVLSGNPVSLVVSLASSVVGVTSEGSNKSSLSETRNNLRNFIAQEQKKDYSPAYDDVKSLKTQVNKQRIQTIALEKLLHEKGIESWSAEKVQLKFSEISQEIAARANSIQDGRSIFAKYGRKIFKSFITAHDPFSKYNDPEKLNALIKKKKMVSREPQISKQQEVVRKTPKQMKNIVSPIKNNLEERKDVSPSNGKLRKTSGKSLSQHTRYQ